MVWLRVGAIMAKSVPQKVLPEISQREVCITQIMNDPDENARPGPNSAQTKKKSAAPESMGARG